MMLRDAVNDYIAWRQAHGAKFDTGAYLLHRFLKHVGGSAGCDAVSPADVLDFLAGQGPLTRYRASKYSRPGRLLPLRDQPQLRDPVAASGAR